MKKTAPFPTTPTLSAFRLGQPLEPLWVSPSGRAFYPIAGGSEDPDPADAGGTDPAGDKGFTPITSQEELDKVLGKRLARERERYADYDDLKTKAAEYDKALEAAKTDQEKAVEAAREEGKTAALQAANARLKEAEARALAAAAKFRNPNLAVKALDLSDIKVGDDGAVDADAIKDKLKALSDADPYLVDDGKGRPKPDRAQGGAGGETKASVAAGADLYAERYKKTSA